MAAFMEKVLIPLLTADLANCDRLLHCDLNKYQNDFIKSKCGLVLAIKYVI